MICPSCGTGNIEGSDRCDNCLAPFRDLDVPRADAAEGLVRHVMEDTLGKLEYEPPIIVAPDTPAIDVATRMREVNTGCALVLDGSSLVGIFTEHDVLVKMFANPGASQDRVNSPVKDLMTSKPEILQEHESVAAALNKMSMGRYRHIPVKKADGSYAVASIKSVLNYIAQEDW